MDDAGAERPKRSRRDRATRWLLLSGDRLAVSALILAGVFAAFVLASALGLVAATKPAKLMWLLNGIVNGLLTLVPIAVGVNQIVLSHELDSIQSLYDRRNDLLSFRRKVENRTETTVSSPRASAFFGDLLAGLTDAARTFRDECDPPDGSELATEVDEYATTLVDRTDRTRDALAGVEFDMRRAFFVFMEFDDSELFYLTRRLRNVHADALSDEAKETLDETEELFLELDAARQYFKTLVVERELATLSRLLIYSGVSAVVIAGVAILSFRDLPGVTLPRWSILLAMSASVTASLAPLAVLSAYVLRVATIARRTASFGPFIPSTGRRRVDERELN